MCKLCVLRVSAVLVNLFLLLLFTCSSHAYAGIRPSFSLDRCVWHATHIVVATEGDIIDGKLTVFESLKGDLRPGEIISVPKLASFKPQSARIVKTFFARESEGPVKYVTGSRMILFLKKELRAVKNASRSEQARVVWGPADTDGINVSVVWIEADQSFAFMQLMNPGPSLLTYYGKTEDEIRDRLSEVIRLRVSLEEAKAIPDCSKKAEALQQFAVSGFYYAQENSFTEMQECGESALPVLRRMLSDPSLLKLHGDVIRSLTVAGGMKVADELTHLVKDELDFWKVTAPKLKEGWWNAINEPETESLRDRYSKVYSALNSLRKLRFIGCREIVLEFRDFWRSLPQLEDKSGLNQMSEECDKILEGLP